MFFKKKSFNKPKPPVKKVTKKWEPTIDLSNIDKKKTVEPKQKVEIKTEKMPGNSITDPMTTDDDKNKYWYTPMYFSDIWVIRRF